MQNCLHGYADRLAANHCRLFAFRQRGAHVGTLEVRPDQNGKLRICQFRGPRNLPLGLEPWTAAHEWIERLPMISAARAQPLSLESAAQTRDERFTELVNLHGRERNLPHGFWRAPSRLGRLSLELLLIEGPRRSARRRRRPLFERQPRLAPGCDAHAAAQN